MLESMEAEWGLILVAVTPLRTKDVEAKEEQLELLCIESDGFWWEKVVSELLDEMHKHVDCSSSWIRRLSQSLSCPELEKHTKGVCDGPSCKQIHIGKSEHSKNAIGYRLIQGPFHIERLV